MKTKFLLVALLLGAFSVINAQGISSYKYIIIPDKFSGFDENEYQLNGFLAGALGNKHYEVLPQDKSKWPQAVRNDNCLALTADIKKGKSLFKNKLEVIFKDCSEKQLLSIEGSSSIKEYNEGYHDALNQAAEKIEVCNAEEAAAQPKEDTVKEMPAETVIPAAAAANNSLPGTFKNGDITLTKSDLTDGSFLLIRSDNSQVYAQFFPASKAGVYHVKMINPQGGDYYTVGYFSNNVLSIETRNGTNKWQLVEFKQ